MKQLFLLLLLLSTSPLLAQSPIGTWKRTAMLLTEANGKTEDSMPEMTQAMPCTARITYTFLANGTMSTNVPDDCGAIKKATEKINKSARWAVNGNKIKVSVLDKSLPESEQVLTFSGNTMTWTFDYAANPQMPNPTKAKRLVIKYQKI